jgi:CheY-like chemotaxis protein
MQGMSRNILLVDDQRDVLRILHSTLDSLKNTDIRIFEAPSGEEALLEASRNQIDLLVADYLLPGITGVELMHKIRVRYPEAKVILISGVTDRKTRDVMLSAGAVAIFDKPVPLADFLDVVERSLGLVRTIFPPEKMDGKDEVRQSRLSDLLANFRQDINAQVVILINERGRVLARSGHLYDSSMEVSLLSALTAIHAAGMKISRYNRQETPDTYHVFRGGDHDLFFVPVTASYALLLAGNELANEAHVLETVSSLLALRQHVERAVKSLGVTSELKPIPLDERSESARAELKKAAVTAKPSVPEAAPAPEMEALLKAAIDKKASQSDVDSFWNDAAEKHGSKPLNSEVISFEEAQKLGIAPGEKK